MVWSISLSLVRSSNINMTRTRQSQNLCKRKEAHAHGAAYAVANLGNTLNLLDSAFWNAPHTSLAAPWISLDHFAQGMAPTRCWSVVSVVHSSVEFQSSKATGKSGKGGRWGWTMRAQTMGARCQGRDGQIVSRCFKYVSSTFRHAQLHVLGSSWAASKTCTAVAAANSGKPVLGVK